jgi:hypothetical protein
VWRGGEGPKGIHGEVRDGFATIGSLWRWMGNPNEKLSLCWLLTQGGRYLWAIRLIKTN